MDSEGKETPIPFKTVLLQDYPVRSTQIAQRIDETVRTLQLVKRLNEGKVRG